MIPGALPHDCHTMHGARMLGTAVGALNGAPTVANMACIVTELCLDG